jgi:hypothetical protein
MAWYSICQVLAFCLHLGNSSMIRYPREAGVAPSTASITMSHDASAALASKPAATAIVIISFVLLFALVALSALKYQSPTIDEPVHLLAGYSYLKWGDFRVNPEHPPLAKLLAALPLLARDIKDPRPTAPEWQQIPKQAPGLPTAKVALEMFFVQNDAEALFFYAKLPFLVLTIFLGLAVFIWAREWFGLDAGVAALLLFASNPNIIAHSTIVHTDMAFAALFFAATYFLQKTLAAKLWQFGLLACLGFAMAAVTKFAAAGIFLTWSLLGVIYIIAGSTGREAPFGVESRSSRLALVSVLLVASLVAAYVAIWAVYGFRYNAIPDAVVSLPMAQVLSPDTPPLLKTLADFAAGNLLFPEAWLYGQLYTITNIHRAAYLFGVISRDGFGLYFPVALLVKTPVPMLILAALALGGFFHLRRHKKIQWLVLWTPIVVYLAIAVGSRMNIGLRHILPIVPFLCVVAGASAARLWQSGKAWKKAVILLLACWSLWNVFAVHPHYLAYFNELAGGSANGHKVLIDSNLDWGQDLKALKPWMDGQGVRKIWLLYFGTAEPAYYGIDAVRVPGGVLPPRLNPPPTPEVPTKLAISANYFYGAEIYATPREKEFLKAAKLTEPIATIGNSILIFDLKWPK